MPSYPARPRGRIVNTAQALRHWAEAPGSAKPSTGTSQPFMHHQEMFESPNRFFYLVHSYTVVCPPQADGCILATPTRPSGAEIICFADALVWLREHGHDVEEVLAEHRARTPGAKP